MINYRVSKPRRAFICTALALSLAPFLIRALVTSDALLRYIAKSRDNFDKFLTEKSINNMIPLHLLSELTAVEDNIEISDWTLF